jgi:CheY-like chemotaxis protein
MSRILIVDDSKDIRGNLTEICSFMGFEVVVAGSGSEALDQFFRATFDLIITDLEMPDMDGWTLASHIKELSPDTPIVLITGSEESAVMEGLETSNVDFVLFKPFSLEEIKNTVHTVLALKTIENVDA